MWGYLPPAVSEVFLPAVLGRLLRGDRTGLEDEICRFLGSRAAAAGSSWVVVLGLLLEELARRRPARREVVLPSYACNEFTKATLLAGLRPRYVDLGPDLAADPTAIAAAIGPATLAVFAVNNVGRESPNARIRELCDQHRVTCVEDATYTFLGRSDHDGRRFGSYGHFAVLNFSEGKIIPVGGGAVVCSQVDGEATITAVRDRIAEQAPRSIVRELLSLCVYRAGSSRWGYTAYRLLRDVTRVDLKKQLSMEPTRAGEVGHDLERDAARQVVFRPGRGEALKRQTTLRPLGRAKQLSGVEIIARADAIRRERMRRYLALRDALASMATVEVLAYPADGTCIKAPVLVRAHVSPAQQAVLDRLGVIRGYAADYPTYGDPAFPSSNRFFDGLFTLPLHRDVGARVIREIASALAALAGPPQADRRPTLLAARGPS
jgi:dTDP-4-amino-4,6-dideoxygalactose transaminase